LTRNLLDRETSPYLLQHKDNPVHWRAWGPEALAEAKTRGVPILLSVGYAACHWCHVMAHESFEDEEIASVMNELYVNIKVDREERPDIAAIYQNALALTGEQGGWPLTMFLTPEGEPFWGGTYFPPVSRYGRPSFRDLLHEIARIHRDEPEKVSGSKARLLHGLNLMARGRTTDGLITLKPIFIFSAARFAADQTDPISGGLGQAPKFPQPFIYELVWRGFLNDGDPALAQAVMTTLTHMAQGGIYDHLGGGFSRYSVDDAWLVPHFEKMLYDNAQLIDLYAGIWSMTGRPLFARRVEETIAFLLREMITPDGGFAASLDADSEGEEGKFYVWTAAEINVLLTDQADEFREAYAVSLRGNFEGHTILNRLHRLADAEPALQSRLDAARAVLLAARSKRVRPGFDDKVLADWNGLTIHALARAGALFDRPDWTHAAVRAFEAIARTMSDGKRLYHSARNGRTGAEGMAEDYAAMARAALQLHKVTGDTAYLEQAIIWVDVLHDHFRDPDRHGYFMTADDAEGLIVRSRNVLDNAVPSANGLMMGVLAHLFHLTGNEVYRARADELVTAFTGDVAAGRYGAACFLNGFDLLTDPVHVTVIGHSDDPGRTALINCALRCGLPNLILDRRCPDETVPPTHPAYGKTLVGGASAAYLCRGETCSLPITSPQALQAALAALIPDLP